MSAFNLKAGLTPITTLLIQTNDLAQIQKELRAKVLQAPNMFIRLPCIFDFAELSLPIDLPSVQMLCHEFGMLPIGVKNAQEDHYELLENLELADFGKGTSKIPRVSSNTPTNNSTGIHSQTEPTEVLAAEIMPEAPEQPTSTSSINETAERIVDQQEPATTTTDSIIEEENTVVAPIIPKTTVHKFPVRSGQQLRAEGDLIIFGLVSAGAEVLAGGSIHIFGPLRGRALAGINGNTETTISCQALEAELVAIAGEYKLFEDSEQHCKQAAVIQLDNGSLNIESL